MNGNYQIGDVVFGNWVILREIGRGSFGTVYVVGHQDDHSFTSALKVIPAFPRHRGGNRAGIQTDVSGQRQWTCGGL